SGRFPGMSSRTEGQVFSGESLAARYASFVKLPHTLFALPFAGVGAVLASYEHASRLSVATAVWIVIAFTAARFAAMGFNRIVDRRWDALNPRTAGRELPSGRLTLNQAWAAVVTASAIFIAAAWLLNPLCGMLSPIALAWIFFYSYGKRFTAGAHHILGLALGIAPVGAFLAVSGTWPEPWYGLPLLAAAVMFWVAGFDVIYAVQALAFDRSHGLHSIPAKLGARSACGPRWGRAVCSGARCSLPRPPRRCSWASGSAGCSPWGGCTWSAWLAWSRSRCTSTAPCAAQRTADSPLPPSIARSSRRTSRSPCRCSCSPWRTGSRWSLRADPWQAIHP